MRVKEEIQIELTAKEAKKIIMDHFSDKYDIQGVYFNVETVYDGYDDYGSSEVTYVKCIGKNK